MVRAMWMGILLLLLVIVGTQLYFSSHNAKKLTADYQGLQTKLDAVSSESGKLQAEVEYFSNPDNLEKELKARFNYRRPDEAHYYRSSAKTNSVSHHAAL